jgi:hypothetical protein
MRKHLQKLKIIVGIGSQLVRYFLEYLVLLLCCNQQHQLICSTHVLLLRAVEDVKLDAAVRMYIDSYGLLQEGQDQMAFASYQNTASIYMKLRGMFYDELD